MILRLKCIYTTGKRILVLFDESNKDGNRMKIAGFYVDIYRTKQIYTHIAYTEQEQLYVY